MKRIHILYVGKGGDTYGSDLIEEIMEFSRGKPITIRPLTDKDFVEEDDEIDPSLYVLLELKD